MKEILLYFVYTLTGIGALMLIGSILFINHGLYILKTKSGEE